MTDSKMADLSALRTLREADGSLRFLKEAHLESFEQRLAQNAAARYRRKHPDESHEQFFFAQLKDRRELETHACPVCGTTLMGRASWFIHIVHAHHPVEPFLRKDIGPWTGERALRQCRRFDKLGRNEKECLRDTISMRRQRDLLLGYREQLLSDIAFRQGKIGQPLPEVHWVSGEDVKRLLAEHPMILSRTLDNKGVLKCTMDELKVDMVALCDDQTVAGHIGDSWGRVDGFPIRSPFPDCFIGLNGDPYVMTTRTGSFWHTKSCRAVQWGIRTLLADAERYYSRPCTVCGGVPFYESSCVNVPLHELTSHGPLLNEDTPDGCTEHH